MAHGPSDSEIIERTHNTARFFVETRQISWVLLIGTLIWGATSYFSMPQRKDPDIPIRRVAVITPWPGAGAEKVEQLVTRAIEAKAAENARVNLIESISRTGLSVVYVEVDDHVKDTSKEFDDLNLKLNSLATLPEGAGPIQFIKDFGDTAALMLTIASPKADDVDITLRARDVETAIRATRPTGAQNRFTLVLTYPTPISSKVIGQSLDQFAAFMRQEDAAKDIRLLSGVGFVGLDGVSSQPDAAVLGLLSRFIRERLKQAEIHPDVWPPIVIRDPGETRAKLAAVAGDKYTYRDLDDFTDLINRSLKTLPQISRVTRSGVLPEQVFLLYSQERLASYGVQPGQLRNILHARNITASGGMFDAEGKNLPIDPSGEFKTEREIGGVPVTASSGGSPIHLRDLVDIVRGYQSPARFLNFYTWRDERGNWRRNRAITIGVQMRAGERIGDFAKAVDGVLNDVKTRLPRDLILARTSDQPEQVHENVSLFMTSLYEAIGLVVVVSFLGFREWRSALLMAFSIPITLAMTFGFMHLLGIDVQQVSIASLIIALGLLVDDPVVAGDAIKRELAIGHPPLVAAWLGPTRLGRAILFATITNIVAYLPFMMLSGDTGKFVFSLPIVIACSLVASRLVSMTFIPLLGYYLLRPRAEASLEEQRKTGFAARYYKIGSWAIEHRWAVLASSLLFLALGGFIMTQLKQQFFPKDLQYLSYVDVWLPEDTPLQATNNLEEQAEQTILKTAQQFGKDHPGKGGQARNLLVSLTSFIGGGGPRFWFSVAPEMQQLNYSQILIELNDKHETPEFTVLLQKQLSANVPGARVDVRQLESGKAVGLPVAVRLSGEGIDTLRNLAGQVKSIFRAIPTAERVRDDWADENFTVKLAVNPDRANLAGVTNLDVAASSGTGINGAAVTTLREGDKQIPVIARMRMNERAQLSDIENLYVMSAQGYQKVPLRQVSSVSYGMETSKIRRRNQFRTITVYCMPSPEALPSEVLAKARPALDALQRTLPPGYKLEIAGEYEEQVKGFKELAVVLGVSVAAIFLALVVQFQHAIKPLIVFAAIPYGMVGALGALWIMGAPFGFMAFLGIVSLVGVIVSHIIVLFDFIEEKHAEGEPLKQALLDAGVIRLRPVLITVGATVIALFPLAAHGGPLWEPLCYSQIGGLCVATFITLLLVPVLYSIMVLDLKWVKWETSD